jgi:RNA 2',3'-cyclic 3'-phosphodiesterase
METIRSFIAIELTAEVKAELAKIQSGLKQASNCASRWVNPESIHLTLFFLGDIRESQVVPVQEAITRTAACFAAFELRLGLPGAFPDMVRPQIIWVGLEGNLSYLAEMQMKLVKELQPVGFKPENRPFSPHLTLARLRPEATPAERQNLAAALAHLVNTAKPVVAVKDISLMKSRLAASGAVYTRLSITGLKS